MNIGDNVTVHSTTSGKTWHGRVTRLARDGDDVFVETPDGHSRWFPNDWIRKGD